MFVKNAHQLYAALEAATGGETILLAPGDYGLLHLTWWRHKFIDWPSRVTLVGVFDPGAGGDAGDASVFTGVSCYKVRNLAFRGIDFRYERQDSDPAWHKPFLFTECQDIDIADSLFTGIGDGPYGKGYGLALREGRRIRVAGSSFQTFERGLVCDGIDDLAITGNEISDNTGDGIDCAACQQVLIDRNHIHGFVEDPDNPIHRDMIQFWTAGTRRPSKHIRITGNRLIADRGAPVQSIFMRNELVDQGQAGREMFYEDLLIANNLIVNAHYHGITIGEAAGVTVRSNLLLHDRETSPAARQPWIPSINVNRNAVDVRVTGNVTPWPIVRASPAHVVADNLLVQQSLPAPAAPAAEDAPADGTGDGTGNGTGGAGSTAAAQGGRE